MMCNPPQMLVILLIRYKYTVIDETKSEIQKIKQIKNLFFV